MAQQMAIYDQGCTLMVGVPFRVRTNRLTTLDRIQVRTSSALDDWSFDLKPGSHFGCPE